MAQDRTADADRFAGSLHQVTDGVHAWVQPDGTWWLNNAGMITGATGTLVVDTCATADRTRRFLDAAARVTDAAPVRWAVNTHEHGDHTYGNCLLPASTTLIGHENMRANLLVDPVIDECPPVWDPVPDWGPVVRRVPDLVVDGDLALYLGGRRVEVLHPGHRAHTTGDLVVWLPAERVLFTGDLIFHGLTPLMMAGSIDGALRTLDWIAGLDPLHLVPGHGPLATDADLDTVLGEHERYYRFLLALTADALEHDRSPLAAAREADLGEFAEWLDAERIVLNLHRAFADATGTEFDIVAAFTDAIEWIGGPLTTRVCCTT